MEAKMAAEQAVKEEKERVLREAKEAKEAEKRQEKEAKEAEKRQAKEAKEAEKRQEKERKDAEEKAEKERKEEEKRQEKAEKERKEREKKEEKERKDKEKREEKERKEEEKRQEKERKEAEKKEEKEEAKREKKEEKEEAKRERETMRNERKKEKEESQNAAFNDVKETEVELVKLLLGETDKKCIELTEKYNGPKLLWLYYNWDKINVGKAYDHASRQYLADQVYKQQFKEMLEEIDPTNWPIVERQVQYTQASYGYGRYMSRATLGLQGISRSIRHTISEGIYNDLDMKSAHIILYLSLCRQLNLPVLYVNDYYRNKETWVRDLIQMNPLTNAEFWKKIFLARLNGGKIGYINEDTGEVILHIDGNKVEVCEFAECREYINEIRRNHVKIVEYFDETPQYQKYRKSVEASKGKDGWNLNASIVNHWLCDTENKILNVIIDIAKEHKHKVGVLCFDGLMLEAIEEEQRIELKNKAEDKIKEKLNIDVKLAWKGFDEKIVIREEELEGFTKYDPVFKFFDWSKLNDDGSDLKCAEVLKPLLKKEFVLTDIKNFNGLTFNDNTRLWEWITAHHIQNRIGFYFKKNIRRGIKYWLNRLVECEDKTKATSITKMLRVWTNRISDNNSWCNIKKLQNTLACSKALLLDDTFVKKMNSITYELPIKGEKILNLKTGQTRERTYVDKWDYETATEYKEWNSLTEGERLVVNHYMKNLFKNDEQVIKFMQILGGMMLTRENSDRRAFFVPGEGSNGKSFFFQNILGKILGQGFNSPDSRNLVGQDETKFIESLAEMSKASLSVLSELPAGSILNETLIKKITGNDTITKEKKGKPESLSVSFMCKLVILFNWGTCPDVGTEDQAFWDRVVCLWFPADFRELSEEQKKSKRDMYEKHLYAFFSYFVEGAKMWYANPDLLRDLPEKIKENTDKFKKMKNIYNRFIEECCDIQCADWTYFQGGNKVINNCKNKDCNHKHERLGQNKAHLYGAYKNWAIKAGIYKGKKMIGQYSFYEQIEKLGYVTERFGEESNRMFSRIKLKQYHNQTEHQHETRILIDTDPLTEEGDWDVTSDAEN
jgi:P4 family phage/plasmid primase-like protien